MTLISQSQQRSSYKKENLKVSNAQDPKALDEILNNIIICLVQYPMQLIEPQRNAIANLCSAPIYVSK